MSTRPLHLFVFIDALGWPLVQRHDFLPEMSAARQPVQTVLGFSSGAVPTILTGLLPRQHGQWSFFYYAPDTSPFGWMRALSVLPHRLAANHRVRGRLSRALKKVYGYGGYFSLYAVPFSRLPDFDYCEKRDLFAPGGMPGAPTLFDAARAAGLTMHVSDWRAPEDHNLAAAREALARPELDAAFVYLPAFDGALHLGGHAVAHARLPRYETEVRALIQCARDAGREVVTRVFSDHGMAEVRRVVDLRAVVETDDVRYGRDLAVIYDSTMVRLWWLDPRVRPRVLERLDRSDAGRLLSADELAFEGLDFPGQRYGQDIFLCHPGVLVVPSDMGLNPIAGMHGYESSHEDSDAMLISDAPLPLAVRRIDDFNTLMRADLGLPPAPGWRQGERGGAGLA